MSKSQSSFSKKEKEKKRLQKRQEKKEKKDERQANSSKGKGLEDMIAYVDEFGNFSDTPPEPGKRSEINLEDIQISVSKHEDMEPMDKTRKGIVSFFNESRGFGFINDLETKERVFVHINDLVDQIKEDNRVTFEVAMGHKGPTAVNVRIEK